MPQSPQSLTIYRQEIIEIQKNRTDLMKWKLILIGGIGSFGLSPQSYNAILLALIPFVCVYVDALCYQQSLKVFIIAKFISERRERDLHMHVDYEMSCQTFSKDFSIEDIALVWSSVFLYIATPLYLVFTNEPLIVRLSVVVTSVFGFLISLYVLYFYAKNAKDLGRATVYSFSWLRRLVSF